MSMNAVSTQLPTSDSYRSSTAVSDSVPLQSGLLADAWLGVAGQGVTAVVADDGPCDAPAAPAAAATAAAHAAADAPSSAAPDAEPAMVGVSAEDPDGGISTSLPQTTLPTATTVEHVAGGLLPRAGSPGAAPLQCSEHDTPALGVVPDGSGAASLAPGSPVAQAFSSTTVSSTSSDDGCRHLWDFSSAKGSSRTRPASLLMSNTGYVLPRSDAGGYMAFPLFLNPPSSRGGAAAAAAPATEQPSSLSLLRHLPGTDGSGAASLAPGSPVALAFSSTTSSSSSSDDGCRHLWDFSDDNDRPTYAPNYKPTRWGAEAFDKTEQHDFSDHAASMFRDGTVIGEGGEGQVRSLLFRGKRCAVKRVPGICLEGVLTEYGLEASPWVALPLGGSAYLSEPRIDENGSSTGEPVYFSYTPYALAEGDLQQACRGLWAAAAAGAAPSADAGSALLAGGVGAPATTARQQPEGRGPEQPGAKAVGLWRRNKAALTHGSASAAAGCSSAGGAASGAARGSMSEEAFQLIFGQLLVGLSQLHDAGLRHADFKPANVLIAADGGLRIGDLGLAAPAHWYAGEIGTPGFMAPEQTEMELTNVFQAFWVNMTDKIKSWSPKLFPEIEDWRPIDVWALALTALWVMAPSEQEAVRAVEAARARAEAEAKRGCSFTRWLRRRWRRGCGRLDPAARPAWLPESAAHLILQRMLAPNPFDRPTVSEIRAHPFFADLDFSAVEWRRVRLPFDLAELAAAGRGLAG